jgi:hypothetical protein
VPSGWPSTLRGFVPSKSDLSARVLAARAISLTPESVNSTGQDASDEAEFDLDELPGLLAHSEAIARTTAATMDARSLRAATSDLEQQKLGVFSRRQGDRALGRDARAVARAQHELVERHRSFHDVYPGAAPRCERVNDVFAAVEERRTHEHIGTRVQRASPTIRCCHDLQAPPALRGAEAPLFLPQLEAGSRQTQKHLKDVRCLAA